ncbi:MAG TPA: hypothetical protein VK716_18360 [Terracidiphilus sp.]|jgi:hypothetical protein|nr:hypothetical protein [Terracidiphilus sp.]
MAGYSGTPLLQKLGIKEGQRVMLRRAPADLPKELSSYAGARLKNDLDVVLLFPKSLADFKTEFASNTRTIKPDGMIWVAWPKKASGVATDLTENAIRDLALKTPFVDVKVCAINETWSGLKFVVRKEFRTAFASGSA